MKLLMLKVWRNLDQLHYPERLKQALVIHVYIFYISFE